MATNVDYLTYVLNLLRDIDGVTYRKMMGEYLLYKDGILFGGIYDNRFLVKKTKSLEGSSFREEIPYPGAKMMLLIDIESRIELEALIDSLVGDLSK